MDLYQGELPFGFWRMCHAENLQKLFGYSLQLQFNRRLIYGVMTVWCFAFAEVARLTFLSKLSPAAQVIIGRCRCRVTVKFVKGNMTDFQVLEKSPGCDKTEVM